jgi:hypothetical protein
LDSNDKEVLTDACWALSYLSDGTNDKIQAVIEAGVCRRLVELLGSKCPSVLVPALRTVGNIVTVDDRQTQSIINSCALPSLLALLTADHKKSIKKEACWTISNITAGNTDQIQAIVESNIIPPLIYLLAHAEFDIKKEAAWAIRNATHGGTHQQIKYLVDQGCVKPLCDLIVCSDAHIVTVALEGLETILKVGEVDKVDGAPNQYAQYIYEADGLEKIENLQNHNNNDIYDKAMKILEEYFGPENIHHKEFAALKARQREAAAALTGRQQEAAAARKAQEDAAFSELALWRLEVGKVVATVGLAVKQISPVRQHAELDRQAAVYHVVNPVLQAAYEQKKKELAVRLGDANVNERFLFHGTSLANSEAIISNNFSLSKVRTQSRCLCCVFVVH